MSAPTSTCWACGRTDVRKQPRHGKLFYKHNCPHGVDCTSGDPRGGAGGMNGPARGGKHYCPACVTRADDEGNRRRHLGTRLLGAFRGGQP